MSPGAYGLVGMGAVFAAATRAPITGVIIIFELTGDYKIILPLMLAIVIATALSNAVTKDTIYTLKLRRRGIDIDTPRILSPMAQITVAEAMGQPPRPLRPEDALPDMVARFAADRADSLPVVGEDGALLGVVTAVDVERAVSEHSDQARVAATLVVRDTPRLHRGDSLEDAVIALGASDEEGIPIIGNADDEMIGWLTHRGLLRAYRRRTDSPA